MMSTRVYKVPEEYEKAITGIIRDYGGIITTKEIYELLPESYTRYSVSTLKNFMKGILERNPDIKSKPRVGYYFEPIPKPEKEPKEIMKDKDIFHNSEGYFDPTAGRALANLMMASKDDDIPMEPGEVWVRDTSAAYSKPRTELVLVIGASKGCVNYLRVLDYKEEKDQFFDDSCIKIYDPISETPDKYFINWQKMYWSGRIPFKKSTFVLETEVYCQIISNIAERFGFNKPIIKEVIKEVPVYETKEVPVEVVKEVIREVPVEKEVIKEVVKEVPVEVVKSKIPGEMLMDLAAAKAKAQAWETAFRLAFGGKDGGEDA